jgi:hypothetical protein
MMVMIDQNSLRTNRAGRLTPNQQAVLRGKMQGAAIWCLVLLLSGTIGWSVFFRIAVQSIPLVVLVTENILILSALVVWLIIFGLSTLYLLGLVNDLRRGWTLQDCGALTLQRLRLPENFFIAHWYFVLDEGRYYPAPPDLQKAVESGKAYCLFFTPSTQTVVAAEPLS